MMKMTQELYDSWIAALTSGKYEQTIEYLCRDGKYCCLGVLAELAGMPKKECIGQIGDGHGPNFIFYDYSDPEKPDSHFEGSVPESLVTKEGQEMLIRFNDKYRLTFAQIAYELSHRRYIFVEIVPAETNESAYKFEPKVFDPE